MAPTYNPGQHKLPPRVPTEQPPPVGTRRKLLRTSTFGDEARVVLPPEPIAHRQTQVDDLLARPRFQRSYSMDFADTSHLEGLANFGRDKEVEEEVNEKGEVVHSPSKVATPFGGFGTSGGKPAGANEPFSAEQIALRRFMALFAWGAGLHVRKHNRGKGRVRRLLKFNEEEGCLSWSGILPPYLKTRVSKESLRNAIRTGSLVTVGIDKQGDVGFQCTRLTDAIVLEIGLKEVIRGCNQRK